MLRRVDLQRRHRIAQKGIAEDIIDRVEDQEDPRIAAPQRDDVDRHGDEHTPYLIFGVRVGHPPAIEPVDQHRAADRRVGLTVGRSEEHTSELQSLMRISYAVFSVNKTIKKFNKQQYTAN